ncbi:MAG: hypothetical protein ABWK00_03290 [Desulfurococcaceae archaeon]
MKAALCETDIPLQLMEVIKKSRMFLAYGVAGVGKSLFLLKLASALCRGPIRCAYISTEETLHYEWVSRAPEKFENVEFVEAFNGDALISTLLIVREGGYGGIFVDSINGPFRHLLGFPGGLKKLSLASAILYSAASQSAGAKVFSSAQVRSGEDLRVEASGLSVLEFYFDAIAFMGFEEHRRFIMVERPSPTPKFYYRITDRGLTFDTN